MLNPEHTAFASEAVDELSRRGQLAGIPTDDKVKATAAVFAEMHAWSSEHLPMGASAEVSEKLVNKGLKAVRNKFRAQPELAEQKYGIDPLTVFSVISALWTVVSWIVNWWQSRDKT
jgi:hypothetical protein